MMSKLKLISGVSAVFVFSFLLLAGTVTTTPVSAQQAPGSLYIYSPQTGQGATIYYGPQMPIIATTTATTSMPMILTGTSTCAVYIHNFHKYGDYDVEVARLQNFLKLTLINVVNLIPTFKDDSITTSKHYSNEKI